MSFNGGLPKSGIDYYWETIKWVGCRTMGQGLCAPLSGCCQSSSKRHRQIKSPYNTMATSLHGNNMAKYTRPTPAPVKYTTGNYSVKCEMDKTSSQYHQPTVMSKNVASAPEKTSTTHNGSVVLQNYYALEAQQDTVAQENNNNIVKIVHQLKYKDPEKRTKLVQECHPNKYRIQLRYTRFRWVWE